MSRRKMPLSWLVITVFVFGISSAPLLASQPAKTAPQNIPILMAQLNVDGQTWQMPVDFNITDVSIDDNRLTLYGTRRDSNNPISLTLNISATSKRDDVTMSDDDIFNFDNIFNHDDAH